MRFWQDSHFHGPPRDKPHEERETPAGPRRVIERERWLLLVVVAMIVAAVAFAIYVGHEGQQARDAVHRINTMLSETPQARP
ncbi:hypothetical protein A11A3_16395 [Alcanivorax hongdengensis A-11-3]|uniref:Uncharacterized protein n=1 Tax=Alcanivorax hongdengensis A-11-3 TaxID=1177179 RepID=L0W888_9GAMM|nr:hypothetical protein [Alcanivorax hongdengensis]EKF72913.1 hypothetical protein A11A3_16395 [Alcanivorax hongdengensis A-11-3]